MGAFVITSPDGTQTFRVTAPDNASSDEVMAYAAANMHTAPPAAAPNVQVSNAIRGAFGALPDIAMGAKQAWDAGAQGMEHLVEGAIPRGTAVGDWLRGQKSAEQANQETMDMYNRYANPGDSPIASSLGRGAGQALVTAPMLPAMRAGGLFKAAAQGAGSGAAGGALTPIYDTAPDDPNFAMKKAKQIGLGTAAGAVAAPALTLAANVVAPVVNQGVKMLQDSGIRTTLGQTAGGIWKSIEDKATSIPLIGDLIRGRQLDSIKDFNKAVYSKALEPFGDEGVALIKSAPVGNDGIKAVGDFLSSKYEQALAQSSPIPAADPIFQRAIKTLSQMVPAAKQADFTAAVQRIINDKITPGGALTPSVAKAADSDLGQLASTYRGSPIGDERVYGNALTQLQQELRDTMARYNPQAARIINAANQGWRTIVQMENAGSMLGAKDGIFTPGQFLNAVKKSDTSLRDRQFARGDAFNQDFAQAADRVLPNKMPNSGTFDRALLGLIAGGGLGYVSPAAIPFGAAASLAYAPGVSPFVSKMMTGPRPEAMLTLGDLLRGSAPYAGLPAAAAVNP